MRRQMLRLTIAALLGLSGAVVTVPVLPVHAATLVSIAVTPANSSLDQGLDLQFKATGTFSDGTTADLTLTSSWGSSVVAVATISATGLAHAVSPGPTNISASNSSVTGSTVLNVYTCGPTPSLSGPSPCGEQFASETTPFLPPAFPPGFGGSATVISKTCGPDGTGTLTFTADGNATGPYPGTFHEAGTIVLAATHVMTADATFTITSGIGNVVGTKSFNTSVPASGSAGNCTFDLTSNFLNFQAQQQQTYQATITTAQGRFSDSGTGGSTFSTSFQGATLVPPFVNAFTEGFQFSNGVLGSPTITTLATSANTGGFITDTATLLLGNAPTGTITFSLFDDGNTTCIGAPMFQSVVLGVNGNGSYTSDPFPVLLVGTFRWLASYSGDAKNVTVTTLCNDPGETSIVTVAKTNPTIRSSATASVNPGSTIRDTATLLGATTDAGGNIMFSLFDPSKPDCTGTPFWQAFQAVSGSGIYNSGPILVSLSGTYRWIAFYTGDGKNNAVTTACGDPGEISIVISSPTITTSATPTALTGGAITDTATLAGGNAPTGSITFSLYGPADATCAAAPLTRLAVTVNGNGSYTSLGVPAAAGPGTYRWVASYGGDANNNPAATGCNDSGESSTVAKASPAISTHATVSASAGGIISDTAILAGGFTPTGTITFSLFGPNNAACAGTAVFTSTIPVNGDGSYPSAAFTPVLPGAYNWVAAYNGDANNTGVTTACNDTGETSTVTKASPTITTSASGSATAGGTIFDTAILAGGVGPTGTITFNLFGPNNATCAGTPVFTSTNPVVSGNGTYSSDPFTPLAAGAYSWIASYSGDVSNLSATTGCNDPGETSTVSKAGPSITTSATASANTGGTISDIATIAGGAAPTGTITFNLFGPNSATCAGTALFTSTKPISGNGAYTSDPFIPALPGTYNWVASYSGDPGNSAATTACGDPGETSTVIQTNSQDIQLQMFRVGRFSTGREAAYIVIVSNTGTVDTSGTLTFTDTLPAGLTFVDSFSFEWNCSVAGQTVTCTFDNSLPVGGFTGLVLIVDVTAPRDTVLTNTGTVTPLDATPADNTASVTVTVRGGRGHEFEGNFEGNTGQNEEATLQE